MALRLRRQPPLTYVLAIVALAAAIGAALAVGAPSPAGSSIERTVTVSRGVIQSTVSGTGSLAPAHQYDLNFGTSGDVSKIYVKEGQHVSDGELLARLDPSSAEVDLAKARADLQSAQDTLTSAESGASTTTTSGQSPSAGSSGPTMSVAAAQAALDSAQLAVTNAEHAVTATYLRAPAAGTIAAVNGSVGDTVGGASSSAASPTQASSGATSTSSGFVTLVQLTRYHLDVSLSESDIGKVKLGQAATVTVNAASGGQFAAHVTHIGVLASTSSSSSSSSSSSAPSSSSSAVSYPVTLTLDQTAPKLKAGMSATADIVTSQANGITIPSQALTGSMVTVVRNGKRSTQQVTTGMAGDTSTQVLSGLKAEDQVIVRSATASTGQSPNSTGQAQQGQRRFGGGGAGGLGGGGGFPGGGGGPPGGGPRGG
jgi:multidrug efflux pump subunit AcrA (membrane-fusion protein)